MAILFPEEARIRILDRVRRACLAHPGAYEKIAWSAPTYRVGERQFAMFADDHHGVGFTGLWLKAPEGAQEELVLLADSRLDVADVKRAIRLSDKAGFHHFGWVVQKAAGH